jgi:hypothetical protein
MTNLAEYELGSNPRKPDGPVLSTRTAAGVLTMTFPRAKFASEAIMTVEAAAQPDGPWSSGPAITSEAITGLA